MKKILTLVVCSIFVFGCSEASKLYKEAQTLEESGKYEEAISEYKKIVESFPDKEDN